MLRRLLLVEQIVNEASVARLLTREHGFECERERWDSFSVEKLAEYKFELIITNACPEWERSASLFHWLRTHVAHPPMLMILPHEPDERLLRSASETVDDFLLSPVRDEELRFRIARILGDRSDADALIRRKLSREFGLGQLVGDDPEFLQAIGKIPAVAASEAPVLLLGETGTGKELCAHAIHSFSPRHSGPFVPVDCGAMPEQLMENELFGHVRGAFTDAHADQRGLVAMADGGTLFLDEVDSLPLAAQSKLLRFIDQGTYRPLGSQKYGHTNVRLIVATNRDLEKLGRTGEFRRDLFFRLNVLQLRLPPLRERRGDIATLASHFLRLIGAPPDKRFTPAALRFLQSYDWPGNVRELFNAMRRAVAFSGCSPILPIHFGLTISADSPVSCQAQFREARQRAIELFEKRYVEEMLRKHQGNVTRAAVEAKKDRRVFGRLVAKYRIDRLNL